MAGTFARFWVNPNGSAATFTASYDGIGDMLCAGYLTPPLVAHAEAIKTRAEAIAPSSTSRPGADGQPAYKDCFRVGSGIREPGPRHAQRRRHAWVSNTHPWAKSVEYGQKGRGIAAHATLRKAAGTAT